MCCVSDDHGPPPATPSDNVTYIRYTIRDYRLSIDFTDFSPGIAYVVRLFTNATNITSYFFVLPVCSSGVCFLIVALSRVILMIH